MTFGIYTLKIYDVRMRALRQCNNRNADSKNIIGGSTRL